MKNINTYKLTISKFSIIRARSVITGYFVIPAKAGIHALALILVLIALASNAFASVVYPPIESQTGTPATHAYRSIDFGTSSINGQRIQIHSNAPAGLAVDTSQLDINNAGIQAGYIELNSHAITAGSTCSSDQMGMIAQQLNQDVLVSSQLQCMYNPTFCSSPGYCYLPVKTSRFTYEYNPDQVEGDCPSGTVVDSIQPSDGVYLSAICPTVAGLLLSQPAHGVPVNGYTSSVGLSYFRGYQTVCSYSDASGASEQVAVAALHELRCTNDSTTFTVDNYTP